MNLKPNAPGTIFHNPTLSSEEILLLAQVSQEAYNDTASIAGWDVITPDLTNYGLADNLITGNSYRREAPGIDIGDANATIFKSQTSNTHILAFRGTEVSKGDWNYWPLRRNFYNLFNPFFSAFNSYIQANNPSEILVTGHSLGGAMVEYFMVDNPGNQYAAVAFASPDATEDSSETRILNIGHENDIVYEIGDFFGGADAANSTTNIYTFIGSERPSSFPKEHSQEEYIYTTERILNSAYYDQIQRDSLVVIDRTNSLEQDIASQYRFVEDAFVLGENDREDDLIGGEGNDVLEGLGENDTLISDIYQFRFGNDTLDGGAGNDSLDGRKGEDTAVFSDAFENYDYTISDDEKTITFTHARSTNTDGTDTLENVEFAQFSDRTVPLPLEDGPEDTEEGNILNSDGEQVGVASLTLPTYMFDGDADYTVNLSISGQGIQYNFAYIIDRSGSMDGSRLQEAKNAYVSLTNSLIDNGIADVSQFAVIPFSFSASLIGPLSPTDTISTIQGLSAGGGTNFGLALNQATQFFSGLPEGATNVAYFLSDGQGSGASNSLQAFADVRAYGIGNADINALNIIDSNNAVLLSDPSQLEAEFATSGFSRDDISQINILLEGNIVETIQPSQLVDSSLGLSFSGSIDNLSIAADAENKVSAEVIFTDGRPTTTVDFIVTAGQGAVTSLNQNDQITPQSASNFVANENSATILANTLNGTPGNDLIRLGAVDFIANADAGDDKVVGNNLANTLDGGDGNDQILGEGGDDRIIPGAGDDRIDGGDGIDTVVYSGTQAEEGPVEKIGNVIKVGSNTDTLTNVEFIQFADTRISTDTLQEVPIFSVSDISITEGNAGTSIAQFSFNLSSPAATDVQFSYQTVDGNATAGSDYNSKSGLVTIPIGETSATVEIEVNGDTEIELEEIFALTLSQLSGATFENNEAEYSAIAAIENDDIAAELSLVRLEPSQAEGNDGTSPFTFTLIRSGNTEGTTTVNYEVTGSGDNPIDAADFENGVLPSGIVEFSDREIFKEITLNIAGDSDFESDEEFTLTLNNASEGSQITTSSVTGTLINDDSENKPPVVEATIFSLAENSTDGTSIGTVTASDPNTSDTLTYAITAGNSDPDSDSNIAFAIDSATGEITVADSGDLNFESTPSFNLTVTVTDAEGLSDDAAITVNLTDVDENTPPIIINNATFQVAENTTTVGMIAAEDADGNDLSFSISGGADQGLFTINDSGELSFNNAPDFETAADADGDNNYQVQVSVTDGSETVTQDLTVSVTDIDEANNEAPTIDDAIFTVDENSTSGTQVGIITATDPENETLTFAIANGNVDSDNDNNLAFAIDPSTGTITVNDSDDLDFEVTPTFNLEVTATDSASLRDTANITVNLEDVPSAGFDTNQTQNGIFTLNGGDSSNIKFTLANNNTGKVNEVGVFVVDDENGNVDGNAPGSDGYLQAALQKSQVIFSAISDRPSGFDLGDIERVLEVDGDARLGFYLISDGTTDTALAELEANGTTNLPVFFSDSSNVQVSDLVAEGFNLNWSDEAGNSDYTNLDLTVQLTQDAPASTTELQGNPQSELIDLSNETGSVSVSVEVHREAAFDNLIGFYQVVDSKGGIDINGDGVADFNPGDTGYEEAALTNRITTLDLLQTDNQQTSTFDGTMIGGSILASFMVVDGTVDEAINNNAEVYFSFLGANSDGVDHIRLLGDNTFGYEDLAGGGDFDYNDMIVKVDFTTV